MLIKSADDKTPILTKLEARLDRPDMTPQEKKKITDNIRNIKRGQYGEKDAAREINFRYAESKNWAVIHDLRFKHGDSYTQIDHLLISRWLEIWVCETKNLSCKRLTINEHGEFMTTYQDETRGIRSPLEQNKRHVEALEAILKQAPAYLPRGWFSRRPIKPIINSVVLLNEEPVIERPDCFIENLDTLIRIDQFLSRIDSHLNRLSGMQCSRRVLQAVRSETLESFAKGLAGLHQPDNGNWIEKWAGQ